MDVTPIQLYFRKRAVRRFIFSNNIILAKLEPEGIVNLGVMHHITVFSGEMPDAHINKEGLVLRNTGSTPSQTAYNVGALNQFAAYDIVIGNIKGCAVVAADFSDSDFKNRLLVGWNASNGVIEAEIWRNGAFEAKTVIGSGIHEELPFILRVHMMGVALAVYYEKDGLTNFVGFFSFGQLFDLRDRSVCREFKFNLFVGLEPGSKLSVKSAAEYLTCGMGQADIRPITHKNGMPYIENNKLWLLMSSRGYALPHPCQGCYSLDPSTFELKLEGVIVFDRGDGLLRNEVGTHLFYDDDAREWRGWTCGFSDAFPPGNPATGLWAVHSKHDPRRGISIMRAYPMETATHSEDPCGIYDKDVGKWRLLTARFTDQGIRAVMCESDNWDGPYIDIAGPVEYNSTGVQIIDTGPKRYACIGGSDKKLRVFTYPYLNYMGDLSMDIPPWADCSKASDWAIGRVWPNIIPLPEGYPSRFIALMMDRENFPGIQDANWTYGALHIYDADL